MSEHKPLWTPSEENVKNAVVTDFARFCGERFGADLSDYDDLHRWSVAEREKFWEAVWDYCGVVGDKGDVILENGDAMPGARFFPNAGLNFAQNLLRHRR